MIGRDRTFPGDGPKDVAFTEALEAELATYPTGYGSRINVTHLSVGVWEVDIGGSKVCLTYYGWGSWVLRRPGRKVELVSTDVALIAGEVYALAL